MPLSLVEAKAADDMAGCLYDFLPGTPHPYADPALSFPGVARSLGLGQYWRGGSKHPAVAQLLQQTLEQRRGVFCQLIVAIVQKGMIYRSNKGHPVTQEEIRALNNLIARVGFKIPELWDPAFLDSLLQAHRDEAPSGPTQDASDLGRLRDDLIGLSALTPQTRGFAFEKFLQALFAAFHLTPRSPFRLVGEQIDGSFEIGTDIYLIEAKWCQDLIGADQLYVFREKVQGKSTWSRGLFVSYSGFSDDGIAAFSRGRATNLIGMTGQDIWFILEGKMSLPDAILRKARHAAETGEFYVSIFALTQ